jgi:hypothetical protein
MGVGVEAAFQMEIHSTLYENLAYEAKITECARTPFGVRTLLWTSFAFDVFPRPES